MHRLKMTTTSESRGGYTMLGNISPAVARWSSLLVFLWTVVVGVLAAPAPMMADYPCRGQMTHNFQYALYWVNSGKRYYPDCPEVFRPRPCPFPCPRPCPYYQRNPLSHPVVREGRADSPVALAAADWPEASADATSTASP